MTVETDKGGYCPEESIAFTVKVENNGNRKRTVIYSVRNSIPRTRSYETQNVGYPIDGPGAEPGADQY